jgi:hypothetical protein
MNSCKNCVELRKSLNGTAENSKESDLAWKRIIVHKNSKHSTPTELSSPTNDPERPGETRAELRDRLIKELGL